MRNPNHPSSSSSQTPPLPSKSPNSAASVGLPPAVVGPPYGFHNLDRRTIVLADGSVRSYFALPPDYPLDFRGPHFLPEPPRAGPPLPLGRDYDSARNYRSPSSSSKRKLPEEDRPHHLSEEAKLGKQVKLGGSPAAAAVVDPRALNAAFLRFVKVVNENGSQKKNYLEDGKIGSLRCIVCGRTSKEFTDVHRLILHAYNAQNAELRVDHLGLHKALCVLMGWNHSKAPDNSKEYQKLSVEDASANMDDLIVWPPCVIIQNTITGRKKDGCMEGLGNKDMDRMLKDLGFGGGKCKSMYGKEGHLGFTLVKFANTQAGLKDADRLAEYFEKDKHGRKDWVRAEASKSSIEDDEKNPALVKVDEESGARKRIFYAYLATARDLEKFDFDTTKRADIKSRRELDVAN